jgi:hypothetical protein
VACHEGIHTALVHVEADGLELGREQARQRQAHIAQAYDADFCVFHYNYTLFILFSMVFASQRNLSKITLKSVKNLLFLPLDYVLLKDPSPRLANADF